MILPRLSKPIRLPIFVWAVFFFSSFFLLTSQVHAAPPLVRGTVTSTVPQEAHWDQQWYLRQIHAPEAWAVTTGSHDVIVALLDGGVDIDHPDLKGNIWTNPHEVPGDGLHGWNFVTNAPDVRPVYQPVQLEDAWTHGTAIASLIGAHGDHGRGMFGVAWNVQIMPLVVLDADGSGTVSNLVKAIRYAVSHGANIINMSLIGYDYDADLDRVIQEAADANVVIVAATGNDATTKAGLNIDDGPAYPVCMKGEKNVILGVGGTDTLNQKAPFANYGKKCTDVSAPALDLFVARPSFRHDDPSDFDLSVPHYREKVTGTSLAAPLVAGVAALLKSAHPDWTAQQVRERIRHTADPIESGVAPGEVGLLGYGLLDAGRALVVDPVVIAASASSSFSMQKVAGKKKIIRRHPIVKKKH